MMDAPHFHDVRLHPHPHVHIHTYTPTPRRTHPHKHTHTLTYTPTHKHPHIHTNTHMHTSTRTHPHIHHTPIADSSCVELRGRPVLAAAPAPCTCHLRHLSCPAPDASGCLPSVASSLRASDPDVRPVPVGAAGQVFSSILRLSSCSIS